MFGQCCVLLLLFFCVQAENQLCRFNCEALSCPCQCYRNDLKCFNKSLTTVGHFPAHEHFKYVDFAFNLIKELKSNQFNTMYFKHVNVLQLSANKIERLEEGCFHGLQHVHSLFLSSNKLRRLDGAMLKGLDKLKRLYLDNNQLEQVSKDAFQRFGNTLTLLYLQGNRIHHLPTEALKGLARLKTLDVSGNRIKTLDARFLSGAPDLRHLFWGGNPWHCDAATLCSTVGALKRRGEEILMDIMKCSAPEKRAGKDATILFEELGPECDAEVIRAEVVAPGGVGRQGRGGGRGGSRGNALLINVLLMSACLLVWTAFHALHFIKFS